MRRCLIKALFVSGIAAQMHCGSLISELERIRNRATDNSSVATPAVAPSVLYTIPADGTVSASVQNYIDVVFDQPIEASTATGAGAQGACTGTVSASYNDFQGCGGTASTSGNTVRMTTNPMPRGVTIKVRINGVKGTNGATATPYQSAIGFSFVTPCGQHCFYSDSAPLSGTAAAGSSNFYISAGSNAGKYMIVHGAATGTTLYDPATNQTATGPVLIGLSPGAGSHSFTIPSGANAGHQLLINGAAVALTNRYDITTNAFVAGPGLSTSVGNGAVSFLVTGGTYAGKIQTVIGNGLTSTNIYDNATNTFGPGPTIGAAVSTGGHGYRLDSGPQAGQFRLLVGSVTTARYYDDATDTWTAGTNSNCAGNLPISFRLFQGAQLGKFYQVCGGGAGTNLYDQNVTSVAGAVLPAGVNAGAIHIPYFNNSSNNNYLVFNGNNTNTTLIYKASTDSWAVGPSANAPQNSGSNYLTVNSGSHVNKHFIVLANGVGRTAMFDPATGQFSGTRPFSALGIGGNYFSIKSGLHQGKVLIVGAGGTLPPPTTIYDPQTAEMIPGPDLAASITAGAGSHSFLLTSGPNAGKVMLINAQNSMNSQFYDPSTNTFAVSGATGMAANVGAGANSFYLSSGPQAGKFLLNYGGGSAASSYYDQSTNSFSIGPGNCGVNTGGFSFPIPSGPYAGHQFLVCGAAPTRRIDPSGPTVIATPSLSGSAGAGASAIYVKSGVHAGKFIIIHAGATTGTTVYDPSNDTLVAGPATTACTNIGVGSVSFEITAGAHKGKFLITLGALTAQTCLYDPATNTYAFGPNLGPHPGYGTNDGTVAFPTGGGLYPSAYVIVHGGFFGAFSHFFQY